MTQGLEVYDFDILAKYMRITAVFRKPVESISIAEVRPLSAYFRPFRKESPKEDAGGLTTSFSPGAAVRGYGVTLLSSSCSTGLGNR